jgi:hypothetical protein
MQGSSVPNTGSEPRYRLKTKDEFEFDTDTEYTLTLNTIGRRDSVSSDAVLEVYLTGSAFNHTSPHVRQGKKIHEFVISGSHTREEFLSSEKNFFCDFNGSGSLSFVIKYGDWYVSDVSVKAAKETSFSPDSVEYIIPITSDLYNEELQFKAEFFDVNNNYIPVDVVSDVVTFDGGTRTTDVVILQSNLVAVSFDADGNPDPAEQTASFNVSKTIGGDPTWSFVDNQTNDVDPIHYYTSGAIAELYVSAFGENTQSISVTAEAGGKTSTNTVFKLVQGRDGPGLLYIGDYYVVSSSDPFLPLNNNSTARDIVSSGSDPYTYFAFDGTDGLTIHNAGAPPSANWEQLSSFASVATDILLATDAYIQKSLIIGTNAAASTSNILLYGQSTSPYMSISQTTKGYNQTGVFLGMDGGAAKLSLRNGTNGLTWDGSNLNVYGGGTFTGNLSAAGGTFTGTVSAGIISASTITGGSLTGTTINIGSGNFTVDASGNVVAKSAILSGSIYAANGYFGGDLTGNNITGATITGGSIDIGSGNFTVNSSGVMSASSGYFAGTIAAGALISSASITGGSIDIGGGNFTVDSGGNVTASNAEISGTIKATDGEIGGWSINATYLAKDVASGSGLAPDDYPFYAGSTYANRATAPIRVGTDGTIVAEKFIATGTGNIFTGSAFLDGLTVSNAYGTTDVEFSSVDSYNTNVTIGGVNDAYLNVGGPTGVGGHIVCNDISGSFRGDGSGLTGLPSAPGVSHGLYLSTTYQVKYNATNTMASNGNVVSSAPAWPDGSPANVADKLLVADASDSNNVNSVRIDDVIDSYTTDTGQTSKVVKTTSLGAIRATGDVIAYYSSDKRLKTDIITISDAVSKVKQLNGVTFKWNDTAGEEYKHRTFHNEREAGLIAQELIEVLPEAVKLRNDGFYGIKYDQVIALLVEAVKELTQKVERLEKR